jgi:crossover junction endodeoxyribonuclease RuvC
MAGIDALHVEKPPEVEGRKLRILGVDPGIAITGWAVLDSQPGKVKPVAYACVYTPAHTPVETRLAKLFDEITAIIAEYLPDCMVIEQLFFNQNVTTAITVGEARGVLLLAAARAGLEVAEYTPLQVKQAVVGYGRAEKRQVQEMVRMILGLESIPKPDDAADALAIAICHGHSARNLLRGEGRA